MSYTELGLWFELPSLTNIAGTRKGSKETQGEDSMDCMGRILIKIVRCLGLVSRVRERYDEGTKSKYSIELRAVNLR